MSESTHTPGPWFIFGNGHCVGGPKGPIDGDPRQQTAGVAMCGMRLRTEDEAKANARLIAAAPDLLAACEMLISDPSEEWSQTEFDRRVGAARDMARAAVKKAKGE